MLCVQFGQTWLSGSWEKDKNVKSLQMDRRTTGDQRSSLETDRLSDDRWSGKLIWAFSSGELKKYEVKHLFMVFNTLTDILIQSWFTVLSMSEICSLMGHKTTNTWSNKQTTVKTEAAPPGCHPLPEFLGALLHGLVPLFLWHYLGMSAVTGSIDNVLQVKILLQNTMD